MHGKSQRALFGFVVLALVGWVAWAASLNAQAPAQAPGYKNVQTLKDVPVDLMQPTMQLMEIALGVHCAYCHDADATKRDLDSKPEKVTARRMM